MRRFPFLDWPHPIPFAHRGGAAEVGGENTLAAFERAAALGYRYLETDGRVTSDGVLLAFHDERLDRVTDLDGRLEDRPWSEVRQAKVGPEAEPITTMEGLLDASPEAPEELVDIARRRDEARKAKDFETADQKRRDLEAMAARPRDQFR